MNHIIKVSLLWSVSNIPLNDIIPLSNNSLHLSRYPLNFLSTSDFPGTSLCRSMRRWLPEYDGIAILASSDNSACLAAIIFLGLARELARAVSLMDSLAHLILRLSTR